MENGKERRAEKRANPLMDRYFSSMRTLILEYRALQEWDPNHELLGLIAPMKNNGDPTRPLFVFTGFERRYPLNNETNRSEIIRQQEAYEKDILEATCRAMSRHAWRF